MDALGINWAYLFSQFCTCIGIILLLVLGLAIFRFKQPSKPLRILIGLATGWVTAFFIFLFILQIIVFAIGINNPNLSFNTMFNLYDRLMPVNAATFYLMLLLVIYYLFHIFKSPVHQRKQRVLYTLALLIATPITMPIYYFQFIRQHEASTP